MLGLLPLGKRVKRACAGRLTRPKAASPPLSAPSASARNDVDQRDKSDNDRHGDESVAIGARVGSLAAPSEVLVSQTIRDLTAGSGLIYEDRGERVLKGIPEPWRLFRAVG